MTPQQLIDMPGYGKAEQHLRATGQWDLTKEETLEKVVSKLENIRDYLYDAIEELEEHT
jgi:GTP-binding protein EngB required for normal cell division